MNDKNRHPADFSPYLDRDYSDKRYQDILAHLGECEDCREEVRVWQSVDAMFRSPELEIEVPPFQWSRIVTSLESSRRPRTWREGLPALWVPSQRTVWNATLVLILMVAVALSGLELARHRANQRILAEVAASMSEWHQSGPAENPFEAYVDPSPGDNPFERFQYPETDNPFAPWR